MQGSTQCPKCGGWSKVIDTRYRLDRPLLRRRRCLSCGLRWSTLEVRYIRTKKEAK
jgi:transcriptional regulator NrdR family protein